MCIRDSISDDGANTFPTYSNQLVGANYDAETKSYKVTDTGGDLTVNLTDLHDDQIMIQGFTTEFWFRQISQTGTEKTFLRIGYFDGNAIDYVNLGVLINGIQLEWDNFVINATSPNLKMFDWLYIALWRQESSWYLLVGQNSQYYLTNPASDIDYPMRGISNIQLVGSNVNGVQYYIRDLFVSDGRE